MKPEAIIYTSNTGFTRRYAVMLGEKLNIPVYRIEDAKPDKAMPVVYMGWLMAASVKDYHKAARWFDVRAVVGVGLCPTGELLNEVRRTAKIPEKVPLFTVQGGMDHAKLKGVYRFAINMLVKMMTKKKDKTEGETEMLRMIIEGGDFVNPANLSSVINWYNGIK